MTTEENATVTHWNAGYELWQGGYGFDVHTLSPENLPHRKDYHPLAQEVLSIDDNGVTEILGDRYDSKGDMIDFILIKPDIMPEPLPAAFLSVSTYNLSGQDTNLYLSVATDDTRWLDGNREVTCQCVSEEHYDDPYDHGVEDCPHCQGEGQIETPSGSYRSYRDVESEDPYGEHPVWFALLMLACLDQNSVVTSGSPD